MRFTTAYLPPGPDFYEPRQREAKIRLGRIAFSNPPQSSNTMGLDQHGDAVSKRSAGTKPFGFKLSDRVKTERLQDWRNHLTN